MMKDDSQRTTFMSPTSFIAEIMLVFMGLSGISVLGVCIGYFQSLPIVLLGCGLFVGLLTIIICLTGLYVLLYQDYRCLKLFLIFLTLFLGFQLTFLVRFHFFTSRLNLTEEQTGSLIALDVCFGLTAATFMALCYHLKHKGSTIEMVKL